MLTEPREESLAAISEGTEKQPRGVGAGLVGIIGIGCCVVVTGLVTYGALYGLTTWLGGLGDQSISKLTG